MELVKIEIDSTPGTLFNASMGDTVLGFVLKYNYTCQAWSIDVYDSDENSLIAGMMGVPYVVLTKGNRDFEQKYGSLMIVEKETDDHKDPDLIGVKVFLLWFPPEYEVTV